MQDRPKLTTEAFDLFRAYIEKASGINLNANKTYLVEYRLFDLMLETQSLSYIDLFQKLTNDRTGKLATKVIDAITTNETFWFRDKSSFEILEKVAFPYLTEAIKKNEKKIRIWSAACSCGQEPYTIAMIIKEYCEKNPLIKPADFEILATDISSSVIFNAISGRYPETSIARGLPDYYKSKYFTKESNGWQIIPEIKKMIQYKQYNLLEDFTLFGHFDVIFCRNVLIYFSREIKNIILHRFAKMQTQGDFFFTGPTELLPVSDINYKATFHEKIIYYNKL